MKTLGYIHTLEGLPARFEGNQICYCNRSFPALVLGSINEIRKERRHSISYRKKNNLDDDITYGQMRILSQ